MYFILSKQNINPSCIHSHSYLQVSCLLQFVKGHQVAESYWKFFDQQKPFMGFIEFDNPSASDREGLWADS